MLLTCPHCQFSKEVPDARLPREASRVKCPQCGEGFDLPARAADPEALPQINCPACGTTQPKTGTCKSCGLIIAKYRPSRPATPAPAAASETVLADRPKAGFWLRLVALLIDGFLVFMMQVVFGILLVLTGSEGFNLHGSMSVLIQTFSTILSFFYWIFFTGYCGQTPGKMLLRIQVIRLDGETVGYGKAFYREVIGKFISALIFLIGYLMAAFDDQKQALHDRMARTYVVKL